MVLGRKGPPARFAVLAAALDDDMRTLLTPILLGTALLSLDAVGDAYGAEPCALLGPEAAGLLGGAAAEPEPLQATTTSICSIWRVDGSAQVELILETAPNAAQSLAFRRMLATEAPEPDQTFHDEEALGPNAFSITAKDQVTFSLAGESGMIALSLDKDAGVTEADVERLRAFAKSVRDAR